MATFFTAKRKIDEFNRSEDQNNADEKGRSITHIY